MPTSSIEAAPTGTQGTLTAESVGACVPRNASGSVHSVFRRACNIEMRSGELVTLLAPELGNLPGGIRCALPGDSFAGHLRPGQAATIEGAVLHVPAARLRIDFSRSPAWHCERVAIDVRDSAIVRAVDTLRAMLCRQMPAGGFSPLLFTTDSARTPLERSIGARLGETLPALRDALQGRDADQFAAGLARIVGVGVGLTPSGDDFVVGLLAALWGRSGVEAGLGAWLHELVSPVFRLASRANAVSRQQLVDAIHRRFAQPLVDVLRALAQGRDLSRPVRRALASGYSSGADTLSGLWFGLSLPAPARRSRLSFRQAPAPATF